MKRQTKSQAISELQDQGYYITERLPIEFIQDVYAKRKQVPLMKFIRPIDKSLIKIIKMKELYETMTHHSNIRMFIPDQYEDKLDEYLQNCLNTWSGQAFEDSIMQALQHKNIFNDQFDTIFNQLINGTENLIDNDLSEMSKRRLKFNQQMGKTYIKKHGVNVIQENNSNKYNLQLQQMLLQQIPIDENQLQICLNNVFKPQYEYSNQLIYVSCNVNQSVLHKDWYQVQLNMKIVTNLITTPYLFEDIIEYLKLSKDKVFQNDMISIKKTKIAKKLIKFIFEIVDPLKQKSKTEYYQPTTIVNNIDEIIEMSQQTDVYLLSKLGQQQVDQQEKKIICSNRQQLINNKDQIVYYCGVCCKFKANKHMDLYQCNHIICSYCSQMLLNNKPNPLTCPYDRQLILILIKGIPINEDEVIQQRIEQPCDDTKLIKKISKLMELQEGQSQMIEVIDNYQSQIISREVENENLRLQLLQIQTQQQEALRMLQEREEQIRQQQVVFEREINLIRSNEQRNLEDEDEEVKQPNQINQQYQHHEIESQNSFNLKFNHMVIKENKLIEEEISARTMKSINDCADDAMNQYEYEISDFDLVKE